MARSPFEKSLQTRFDKRELHPSASAWERIDKSLNQKHTTKYRKVWGYLFSVAACTILLMWVSKPEKSGLNNMFEHSEAKVEMADITLDPNENILLEKIEKNQKAYVSDIPVQSHSNTLIPNKIADKINVIKSIEMEIIHVNLEEEIFQQGKNIVAMLDEYGKEEGVENQSTSFDENFREDIYPVNFQIDPVILLASIEGTLDESNKGIKYSSVRSKVSIDPETLLKEVEESEIKSFMEKLTETVVSKSGQVITSVLKFADK
ncbi:MAG TPA: hypothetical protein PKC30_07210 [Saprospiraceae bacterium]|nr:hypothetical protein [Saprospiraceae bacterium]